MLALFQSTKKWLRWSLAALVLALLLWQFYQISQQLNTVAFRAGVLQRHNVGPIALVILLMPFNWWLESWKWAILLRPFHDWSFGRVMRAVLTGVSVSAVTPNRVGEIGGRLLQASQEEAAGVVSSSLLGVLCQWLVFLGLGGPALLYTIAPLLPFSPYWLALALLAGGLGIWLLLWFGPRGLGRLLSWCATRFSFDLHATQSALEQVSIPILLKATLVAAARFLVYLIQLYLLLGVFGIDLPLLSGLAGIAAIYLIQAGIPLPPGINLLTRAELGVLLWGNDAATVAGSLAAFSSLFVVNVLLPSLLAYWLLVKKV